MTLPPPPSRTKTAAFIALSLALTAPAYPQETLPQRDCTAPRASTDLRHCDLAGAAPGGNRSQRHTPGWGPAGKRQPLRGQSGGARLQGANLQWANLADADLSGAALQGAHLFHATLDRAVVDGAQFSKANLFGANLIGTRARGLTSPMPT
jgi:uncharacterized protein YjbI with pentapeptide repeats